MACKASACGVISRFYSLLVGRFWWVILLVTALGLWWAAQQMKSLGVEFQTKTLLDQNDPEYKEYEQSHDTARWSQDEFAVVALSGEDWISEKGIQTLRDLTVDILQKVPHAGKTMSLLDVPLLRQNPSEKPNLFTLGSSMKYLRDGTSGINIENAKTELMAHELVKGSLLSADGKSVNILVYLKPETTEGGAYTDNTQQRWQDLVNGLESQMAEWEKKLQQPIMLAGVPVVYDYIIDRVGHDLRLFGWLALGLFTLALLVAYRRVRFILLPLAISVLPVVAILSFMAAKGIGFTVITSNLPLLLFVISLPYCIYMAESYLERRRNHSEESHADSVVKGAKTLWMPCLFSALTTVAGFAAFATSGIVPVKWFGILMAIGTSLALLLVFLVFPAALMPWKPISPKQREIDSHQPRQGLAGRIAELTIARPKAIALFSAVLLIVAVIGAFRITAENKFTSYFWPSSRVYQGLEFIDRQLGGTSTLEIRLDSTQSGYFLTDEGLAAIASVEKFFAKVPETGSVRSLVSLGREIRKTFKPEDTPGIKDGFFLQAVGSMAPELTMELIRNDGTQAWIQVRMMETAPTLQRQRILGALQAHLAAEKAGPLKNVTVESTGLFVLYANMLKSLIDSQIDTLGAVVLAIFVMLLVLFRSLIVAVLVILPQALPATVMLGVMGWCHIPLDLVTVMIAAIAIGVGVDSAIQYTMRWRQECAEGQSIEEAIRRTHATTGRAIWLATTVIVVGFAVLITSDFFPSVWFGLFTGLAMLMSQFSALLTLPALLLMKYGKKNR